MTASDSPTRPIILLNPGRQSRNYMLGLLKAAQFLGLSPGNIEIGPIREQLGRVSDGTLSIDGVFERLRKTVEIGAFTDIITYANVGGPELGIWNTNEGIGPIWAALGLRHHILWTDHPEWAARGLALHPEAGRVYNHPQVFHYLKSDASAAEARDILEWPNIISMPVAEAYDTTEVNGAIETPRHDAVVIAGSVSAIPEELVPMLSHRDPDPAALDRMMIPRTIGLCEELATSQDDPPPDCDELRRFVANLLESKASQPFMTVWQHTMQLQPSYPDTVRWLRADPQRWYAAQRRLRQSSAWRRSFWLAWLARRVDLGIYGCDASAIGVPQSDDATAWVNYESQSEVYARGRCAININQSHDESGVTHKPFQIAAAGVPMIHHTVAELTDLFVPDREICIFSRGPELLHTIDNICADDTRGPALAKHMQERATREHAWTNRVESMLTATNQAGLRIAA